jgi:hypothetical protein
MDQIQELALKISQGTATPQEIALYQSLVGNENTMMGRTMFDPTFGNSMYPTGNAANIQALSAKVSQGTATPQEMALYRNLVANENASAGRTMYDPNFGSSMFSQISPEANLTGPQGPDAPRYSNPFAADTDTNNIPDYLQMNTGQGTGMGEEGVEGDEEWQNRMPAFPFIFAGGSDVSSELYSLGRAIGAPAGSRGRMMTGIASAGAAAFDIARNIAGGIGFEKRNQYVKDWYANQQRQNSFTPNPQYRNTNTVGGITYGQEGGELFQGEMTSLRQPTQGDQMRQMAAFVMDMLQEGEQPDAIIENLIGQGVPEAQAQQIVSLVMEQTENQQGGMKKGGNFTKKPGDKVTFMHGGKKHSGVIKEIVNGEIVLK